MNQPIHLSVQRIMGLRINAEPEGPVYVSFFGAEDRNEVMLRLMSPEMVRQFLQPKIPMGNHFHYLVGDEVWCHTDFRNYRYLLGVDLAAILVATLGPLAAPEVA